MRTEALALVAAGAAALSLVPEIADACSPPADGLRGSLPESGETYPANAALVLFGQGLDPEASTVTVGGQPAKLVGVPSPVGAYVFARVEPQPTPGQKVVVEGTLCSGTALCGDPHTIEFTAGDPLTVAPELEAVEVNLYDHGDPEPDVGGCSGPYGAQWFVHARVNTSGSPGPIFLLADTKDGRASSVTIVGAPRETLALRSGEEAVDPGTCITVRILDAAGNEGAPREICGACHYKKDDVGTTPDGVFSLPDEPSWTKQDVFDGGSCAGLTGGGDADAGGDGEGSCTLRAGAQGSGAAGVSMGLGLVAFWMRARRRVAPLSSKRSPHQPGLRARAPSRR